MIITQIMHGMWDKYSRVPGSSLWCVLYYVYAKKIEHKRCTEIFGGVNRPLSREDRCTLDLILYSRVL
jgi:hypothetical protein